MREGPGRIERADIETGPSGGPSPASRAEICDFEPGGRGLYQGLASRAGSRVAEIGEVLPDPCPVSRA